MSSYIQDKRPPVIIIVGPTCVGKTGFSVLLAKRLNTEIISADSMQIYRHMDIGTAKPPERILKEVRHHLINILPPQESFSAGMFKKMAIGIINELHARDKVPIVVGGTGLYIKTLTRGLFEGPEADWTLREELMEKERQFGEGYLYKYLHMADPEAAKRINPNDTRRIIRAIEVLLKSNRKISELQYLSTKPLRFNFIKIGLIRDRKELYALIEHRVDAMMEKGLLNETKELLKKNPHKIALQALGYKEMRLCLDGSMGIEEAVRLLKKRTKMYAKRQLTWFKKEPGIQWVDITGLTEAEEVFKKVMNSVEILRELIYGKKDSTNL